MKYAYFPGCSLHSTSIEYDISFRAVCGELGIELVEPDKWICCGSTPAHATSRLLALTLPMKSMCLAEQTGLAEMVVPCASCFQRLKTAQHKVLADEKVADEVAEIIDACYQGRTRVIHPLEVFTSDAWTGPIQKRVRKDLARLKLACYYGCLLTRPPDVMQFDECEYPVTMDHLLTAVGAKTLDWSYKTECCGGAFALSETDLVLDLCYKILEDARAVGAMAVVVACPLCHVNLDTRQAEIEKKYGTKFDLPILFFSQVMGLAFGLTPEQLAMHKHLVSPMPLVEQKIFSTLLLPGHRADAAATRHAR